METFQFMPTEQFTWGPAALVLLAVWGLANCFLGYYLFRLVLVVNGLLLGAAAGAAMVTWLRPMPMAMDYLIACGGLAVLLALMAWLMWRVALALFVFGGSAAALGTVGGPGGAAVGVLIGLALAIGVFVAARGIIIVITAIIGASTAAACVGSLAVGPHHPFPAWAMLLVLPLAAVGIVFQRKVSRKRSALTPQPPRRQAGGGIHPPFV